MPSAMEMLFGTGLINAEGDAASAASLEGKTVGIFFSAHWCPPCRHFTPHLVATYKQMQEDAKPFEIVFVSSDRDEASMERYMQEAKMPWLALSFGDQHISLLKQRFGIRSIPTLVIIDDQGNTISTKGRLDVAKMGKAAFDHWQR